MMLDAGVNEPHCPSPSLLILLLSRLHLLILPATYAANRHRPGEAWPN